MSAWPWWKRWLKVFGFRPAPLTISGLLERLSQGPPGERLQALAGLTGLAEGRWNVVCLGLCKALLVPQPAEVREAILQSLMEHRTDLGLGDRQLEDVLLDRRADGAARARAMRALARLGLLKSYAELLRREGPTRAADALAQLRGLHFRAGIPERDHFDASANLEKARPLFQMFDMARLHAAGAQLDREQAAAAAEQATARAQWEAHQEKLRAAEAACQEAARGARCPKCGSTRRDSANTYDGYTDALVGRTVFCADCHHTLENHSYD